MRLQGGKVATVPFRPWADEASVLAPPSLNLPAGGGGGGGGRRRELSEKTDEDAFKLYGQVLAWSVDAR